uniref:Si:dkeyp-104h9.5 n=1 Tax=Sinocyclocheilus rhinocerous TaxID=307959 RepID=A0A673H8Z6_9TELE
MWLQQRLKGLPGLLSSSWARRVLVGLLLFLIFYWYLSSDGLLRFLSMSRESGGAAGVCLQTDLHRWVSLVDQGEGVVLTPQTKETVPFVVGNGRFLVDVDSNKLWVASSSQPGSAPVHQTDYGPIVRMQIPGTGSEARGMMLWYRKGSVLSSRCILTASSHDCVIIREEFVAHRSRPNVYLQRIHISNPTDRPLSVDLATESLSFRSTVEKMEEKELVLSSGRVLTEKKDTVLVFFLFHTMKVSGYQQLFGSILQNISFCVQQKRETHTGLEFLFLDEEYPLDVNSVCCHCHTDTLFLFRSNHNKVGNRSGVTQLTQNSIGLPFLFWFSVASLITLFHLFLFKLIYNEYCGPGAKPLFRSKV